MKDKENDIDAMICPCTILHAMLHFNWLDFLAGQIMNNYSYERQLVNE